MTARASAADSKGSGRIGVRDASPRPARDQAPPAGLRGALRSLPNALTLARLVAVPIFAAALLQGHDREALAIFAAAAATDVLDGFLARILDCRTRFGALADPLADKLLTLVGAGLLTYQGRLPAWVLALLLVRDLGMGAALVVLRASGRTFQPAPVRLGKYATFLLTASLVLAMARPRTGSAVDAWYATTLVLAAECVAVSAVQYFARWKRLMRAPPRSP